MAYSLIFYSEECDGRLVIEPNGNGGLRVATEDREFKDQCVQVDAADVDTMIRFLQVIVGD